MLSGGCWTAEHKTETVLEQATGATPDLTVEQSTERHLKLIGKLTKEDNGKYFSAAEDKELPY